VKSSGSYVYDKNGSCYIDFSTNWCGILGWNLPAVTKAIKEFSGPMYVDPNYQYEPWEKLAKLLIKIAPGQMQSAFRVTSGTEAVEMALQAAMNNTKRYRFVSTGAYHGHSFATLSVGFEHYHDRFPNLLSCAKIHPPYDKEAGLKIEKILSNKDIAAYISEPIICNRGVVEPTKEYFEIVQNACKKYGTVFIIDEVATGFGRTGKMFASEYYDLQPDIVCMGKGLTGGNAVLGACLMNKKLSKSMEYEFSYYSTFAWQPLNVEITLAYLNYFVINKKAILEKVNKLSLFFKKRLIKMKKLCDFEIRMKGLAIAIEFKDGIANKVRAKCLSKGLLMDCLNPHTLTFFPSANMSLHTAATGLNIFKSAILGLET
jgi:acetylornithine/succinyldiaminopimelate/putrescine aminotransferase